MSRFGEREPPPKTYTPLPAAGRVEGPPLAARGHERLDPQKLSGWLLLRISTLDRLHVGSGVSNPWYINDRDVRLARDIAMQWVGDREAPVIPGASLKGAIRSVAEAIGGGCDLDEKNPPHVCAVCALFGHLLERGGYLGRVGFDDALPVDPKDAFERVVMIQAPMPFQPRVRKGRRIYARAPRGIDPQVPYVVVDSGVAFETRLHLTNVSAAELGIVLLASGVDGTFRLRIGGGKFTNLGRIGIEVKGGLLRRGYRTPAPCSLDAKAASALADEALGKVKLAPRGEETLRVLRATLGGQP